MNELTAGWYGIWDAMLGNHIFMERAILKASGKKGLSRAKNVDPDEHTVKKKVHFRSSK